jgi:hypothetical protein
VWLEVAFGIVLTVIGIVAGVIVTYAQVAQSRIESQQLHNFLIDWRGDSIVRLRRLEDIASEILKRLT